METFFSSSSPYKGNREVIKAAGMGFALHVLNLCEVNVILPYFGITSSTASAI